MGARHVLREEPRLPDDRLHGADDQGFYDFLPDLVLTELRPQGLRGRVSVVVMLMEGSEEDLPKRRLFLRHAVFLHACA